MAATGGRGREQGRRDERRVAVDVKRLRDIYGVLVWRRYYRKHNSQAA